ncbi:branched-chain amino acid ABC transporter permease [Patescibacteria group bacterium]|nr:branched-chain amino acid ABC transporter permease [Patescibacteria group bacterium]
MDYILHLLIIICIFSILTVSLNYIAGFAGIISFSHATFYGVGAYTTAILTVDHGFSFLPTVAMGMAVTALVAWLASFPILKLKTDALMLVSFGFAIIAYNIMLNWQSLTKGPLGIKGVMAPSIFGFSFFEKPVFLALVLLVALVTFLFFRRITKSPYGTIIKGIRENPIVTRVNGHSTLRYQRSVFVLGAVFASIAGSLMASYLTFIEPKLFDLMPSVFLVIMIIVGGMASLKGSVLGAIILLLIPEILRFVGIPHSILGETQQMIYGLLLVLMMTLRPKGLIGEYKI